MTDESEELMLTFSSIQREFAAALRDPQRAIPPYDAFVLIAPKRFGDQTLLNTLQPLIGAINVTMMREASLRAAGADASPGQAARWLWSEIEKKAKR